MSRQRLSVLRKKLGAGPPHNVDTTIPRLADGRRRRVLQLRGILDGKTMGEIEEYLGFSVQTRAFQQFIRTNVKVARAGTIPFELCNWQLHNRDIAKAWGAGIARVRIWRKAHKVEKAIYGPLEPSHHLVRAEKEKAQEFERSGKKLPLGPKPKG